MTNYRRVTAAVATIALGVGVTGGCRSTAAPSPGPWDPARAEKLVWQPDDENFGQDRALETSGLALAGDELVACSEKYGRLLFFDRGLNARVVTVGVPRHAEIEGVAWHGESLYLCDEAHAAVYRVDLGDGARLLPKLAAIDLPIEGTRVEGGKIGVEGVEVSADGSYLYLLLERSGDETIGCVSRIWLLRIADDRLVAEGTPFDLPLEDCNWRLTGLAWDGQRLLALKTRYPGERYEIVEIDRGRGSTTLVQDLTEYIRGVRDEGWGNNVEGIAIADDGALWLISDNAVSGVIDDPYPPQTDEKALLVRIPRRTDPKVVRNEE